MKENSGKKNPLSVTIISSVVLFAIIFAIGAHLVSDKNHIGPKQEYLFNHDDYDDRSISGSSVVQLLKSERIPVTVDNGNATFIYTTFERSVTDETDMKRYVSPSDTYYSVLVKDENDDVTRVKVTISPTKSEQ